MQRSHWRGSSSCLTWSAVVLAAALGTSDVAEGQRSGRGPFGGRRFSDPGAFLPALLDAEFVKQLDLSKEQWAKIEEIRSQFGPLFRPGVSDEERRKGMKELDEEAVAILNDEQKKIWEKRKSAVLAQAKEEPQDGGRQAPADAQPSADDKKTKTNAEPRKIIRTESPPAHGGAETVASFSAPEGESSSSTPNGPRLSFNFQAAPWTQVLELFAKTADLTLDLTSTPPGTFTYRDTRSYTPTEALDVLNGYLLPRGYILVRRDRFLVCLSVADGIPPNLAPQIGVDELPLRGKNELVSLIIPVRGLQADQVIDEVRQLLGPQGRASALKNTNSIVVTDVGSHVRRIHALLTEESAIDNRDTAVKAIPLKYVTASEAERMVRRLFGLNPSSTSAAGPAATPQQPQFGGPQGGPWGWRGFRRDRGDREGDPDQQQQPPVAPPVAAQQPVAGASQFANKIHVAADNRTNHLLVTASASLIRVVEEAVQAIDTDVDAAGNPVRRVDEQLSLKIYTVPSGDIANIANTINTIIPGVVLGQDAKLGKLHVQATAAEHKDVAQLIEQLGGEGSSSVAVIHLQKMEPVPLANTLNNLYSKEGARAPMVEADPLGRRLLVRGTPDQILQVRTILAGLGEGDGADRGRGDRGTVRSLTLGGRDPDEFLPLLKDAWSATRRNPIRISVPSRPKPIRDRSVPGAERRRTDANDPLGDAPSKEAGLIRPARFASKTTDAEQKESSEDEQAADDEETTSSAETPPVSMQVVGDQLIITSDDPTALDRMEELYERLSAAVPARTKWHVFYLRSADATDAAQMIERLMPASNVAATTRTGDGLLGTVAGGISNIGRGIMNMSGLNQTLSGSQMLRVVTDVRANALFVTGPSDQVAEVEQILEVLDASELPESLRDRVPRTIPVEFADVEEVADVVETVFKDAMTPDNPIAAAQRGGGFNPLMMLMGGGGQAPNGRRTPSVQLTVGVDRRTNHLIVSCNDSLFQQIETLVKGIDERAMRSRQTVRVVKLDQADPTLVQQTLGTLMPKVTVGATRRSRRPAGAAAPNAPGPLVPGQPVPAAGSSSAPAAGDAMRDAFMQRMFFERARRGEGGGGRPEGERGGEGGGRRFRPGGQ
jgi:type II secretory pathway component GspD/PulD (secretin)